MNIQLSSKGKIIKAAFTEFSRLGYTACGVRQIAASAGTSLGLVNHHFQSKKRLGCTIISLFWDYLDEQIAPHVDINDNPLLFDAIANRAQNQFYLNGSFRQFYLDSLRDGIYYDAFFYTESKLLPFMKKKYVFPDDTDLILLYNRIVPYTIEQTLVLRKEKGDFPSVSYDDLPFFITRSALERFVPAENIVAADQEARQIVPLILNNLEEIPSDEFIFRKCCEGAGE